MTLTAASYVQMLDRLPRKDQIRCLEDLLLCPLEDGVRPVLRRQYLDLTEREQQPAKPAILTDRGAR